MGKKDKTYEIDSLTTEIAAYAFFDNEYLEFIELINGKLSTIKEYAFNGMKKMRTMTLPQTIATIGEKALNEMTELTTVFYLGTTQLTCSDDILKAETNI